MATPQDPLEKPELHPHPRVWIPGRRLPPESRHGTAHTRARRLFLAVCGLSAPGRQVILLSSGNQLPTPQRGRGLVHREPWRRCENRSNPGRAQGVCERTFSMEVTLQQRRKVVRPGAGESHRQGKGFLHACVSPRLLCCPFPWEVNYH